jgi:hypothetical protein
MVLRFWSALSEFFSPFDLTNLKSRKLADDIAGQPYRSLSAESSDEDIRLGDHVEKFGQVTSLAYKICSHF